GLTLSAVCHDSGGHHTHKVYEFSKARIGRRIWAPKGESATGGKRNPVWPTRSVSSRNRKSFRPVILGVNSAKDDIRHRLHIEPDPAGAPA
ncbi:phage terminase large subunit family protein, partial [Escherichia coli]|nr:phage terminase large subunit family protein [Escherichia coli]